MISPAETPTYLELSLPVSCVQCNDYTLLKEIQQSGCFYHWFSVSGSQLGSGLHLASLPRPLSMFGSAWELWSSQPVGEGRDVAVRCMLPCSFALLHSAAAVKSSHCLYWLARCSSFSLLYLVRLPVCSAFGTNFIKLNRCTSMECSCQFCS